MTEAEWLRCNDPKSMLEFLQDKASDRKLKLFACACCRRIWHLLHDERSRRAVEATERFVDGKAHKNEWRRAASQAKAVSEALQASSISEEGTRASNWSQTRGNAAAAAFLLTVKANYPRGSADLAAAATWFHSRSPFATEEAAQAALLRDIVPNPFRPDFTPDTAWLSWNGGVVRALAQSAYDDRELPSGHLDATRLALLADALEDSGCSDAAILDHLRGPGPHVRGCWAVDVVLGKS